MWRVIFILAAALMVGNATGVLDSCDASCVDDDGGKQCPPSCPTCTCAGHAALSMPPLTVVEVAAPVATQIIDMLVPSVIRGEEAPEPLTRPPIAWG